MREPDSDELNDDGYKDSFHIRHHEIANEKYFTTDW